MPRKIVKTREANLNFIELEELAEEIRMTVTNGKPYTLREYIGMVTLTDVNDFGFRKARALLFEPKLESYFPDSVFASLQKKGREARQHKFNEEDDLFIMKNLAKGLEWLADRFYTTGKEVYSRVQALGLTEQLTDEDFAFMRGKLCEQVQKRT